MSDNVTSSSTSSSASLPTVEEINGWNQDRVKTFLEEKKDELEIRVTVIDKIYEQEVNGKAFLRLNEDKLTHDPFKLKYGPASAIAELIEQIKGDQPVAALKRKRKAEADPYPEIKPYPSIREWTVQGVISPEQMTKFYYADPMETSGELIQKILKGEFVALHGPRASGKTTRIYRTMQNLSGNNCTCFYITLQSVNIKTDIKHFWTDIGRSLRTFNNVFRIRNVVIESDSDFTSAFDDDWKPIVIFIDEFDRLYSAIDEVRNSFLNCMRTIKHAAALDTYPILSVIAVGTFGILQLDSSENYDSPFNIQKPLQNPNLSREQVNRLFAEFESDRNIKISPTVIENIYFQTNGHASMVCLCGSLIEKNLTLDNGTFSFASWEQLVFTSLHNSIYCYSTFERIVSDLIKEEKPAVDLLRLHFLPNTEPINITNHQDLVQARKLARNGILITANGRINTFIMSSPLLRSVILRYVLPNIFKNCPSMVIPKRSDRSIDVLNALINAVCIFDKENIKLAALHSYKTSKVAVGGDHNVLVPRESVYQQQLATIFTNWISPQGFEIMSQYHITKGKKHSYSDLVISAPSRYPRNPTVILELLATSTIKELNEHYKWTLRYAESLKSKLNIRDIWVVHFSCQDESSEWPSEQQHIDGLNAVLFWHNLDFTKVYVKARWMENDKIWEVKKHYIIGAED